MSPFVIAAARSRVNAAQNNKGSRDGWRYGKVRYTVHQRYI